MKVQVKREDRPWLWSMLGGVLVGIALAISVNVYVGVIVMCATSLVFNTRTMIRTQREEERKFWEGRRRK